MQSLRSTLVQSPLAWEQPRANLAHFDSVLGPLAGATDLVVLPEMFTTGFTMRPEKNAERHEGDGLLWMKQKAAQLGACIAGSICVQEGGNYYNRLYAVKSDANYQSYNKRHLFRMGNEHAHYTAGKERTIVKLKGWNILPLVCYDLRFPVWCRNRWKKENNELRANYDILLFVANWPEVRNFAWKQLLVARAIENQCFVIAVNRIGADGNLVMHSGDSMVIDPLGRVISKTKAHEQHAETVLVEPEVLLDARKKFPVGLDADDFGLKID